MHYESRDMFRIPQETLEVVSMTNEHGREVSDTPVPKRKPNKDEVNI